MVKGAFVYRKQYLKLKLLFSFRQIHNSTNKRKRKNSPKHLNFQNGSNSFQNSSSNQFQNFGSNQFQNGPPHFLNSGATQFLNSFKQFQKNSSSNQFHSFGSNQFHNFQISEPSINQVRSITISS